MRTIEKICQEIERHRQVIRVLNEHTAPEGMSKTCAIFQYSDSILSELLSFLDTLSEEPDKSLEEEITRTYHDGSVTDTEDIDHVAYENIAHHFAEWQASQMPMPEDTVLFQKGVQEGRRLEREDMMHDALEGYVAQRVHGKLYAKAPVPDEMGLKFGDKVRIVVLKEEEEK